MTRTGERESMSREEMRGRGLWHVNLPYQNQEATRQDTKGERGERGGVYEEGKEGRAAGDGRPARSTPTSDCQKECYLHTSHQHDDISSSLPALIHTFLFEIPSFSQQRVDGDALMIQTLNIKS